MENTENKQEPTATDLATIIQKAVNDAVAPIIAGVEEYKTSQAVKDEGDGISDAAKQWLDAKGIRQPTLTDTDGLSDATKQWLQHKAENRDSGKEV